MEQKKDFLDELAQNLMLIMIVIASVCTLLSVVFQFISEDIKTLFMQFSYYAYGWMVFLALGPAVKRAAFMRIDMVVGLYPEGVKTFLRMFCDAVLFIMMILMCWFSIQNLLNAVSTGAVNAKTPVIPLAMAYAAPVAGYALGAVAYIVRFTQAKKGGAES